MWALFETIEAYIAKNDAANEYLGYPDGHGTDRYATETPHPTKQGKYAMPISESIAHLFTGCEIADSVEYEVIDETNIVTQVVACRNVQCPDGTEEPEFEEVTDD